MNNTTNTETEMMTNINTVADPKGTRPICEECGYAPFDFEFHLACHDFLKSHNQEQYAIADAAYRARVIAAESWD